MNYKNLNDTFINNLRKLINKHNIDKTYNTPDYILAEYLQDCLLVYKKVNENIYIHKTIK